MNEKPPQSKADGLVRFLVAALIISFGAVLLSRTSGRGDLFDRWTVPYFCLLLSYLPLFWGGVLVALRGRALVSGFRVATRSRLFLASLTPFLVLAAIIALRWFDTRTGIDIIRVAALFFLAAGFLVYGVYVAGREGIYGLVDALAKQVLLAASVVITIVFVAAVASRSGVADMVTVEEFQKIQPMIGTPGAEFEYPGQPGRRREFTGYIKNNSNGFNDVERTIENGDSLTRIVVLGDSYVEALQVPREAAFHAVLEANLDSIAGADSFEVIPLGRGGIGQGEQLRMLDQFGVHYDPTLVILLWVPNDLFDNDADLREARKKYIQTWSPRPSRPRALFFPGLAADRFLTARLHRLLTRFGPLVDRGLGERTISPIDWAYVLPRPKNVERGFRATEGLLERIAGRCRTVGAELLIVLRPNPVDATKLKRNPAFRANEPDLDSYVRLLAGVASRHPHVSFLDPTEAFLGGAVDDRLTWPSDGHWNESGHAVAAAEITRFLREAGSLSLPPPIGAELPADLDRAEPPR